MRRRDVPGATVSMEERKGMGGVGDGSSQTVDERAGQRRKQQLAEEGQVVTCGRIHKKGQLGT